MTKEEQFKKIKEDYLRIEESIEYDNTLLRQEKAKQQAQKQNKEISKKGIITSSVFAILCAILAFVPMGVFPQLLFGCFTALGLGGVLKFTNNSFKYKSDLETTNIMISDIEGRLKDYENDRKVLSNDISNYFEKYKEDRPKLETENTNVSTYQPPKNITKNEELEM